MTGAPVLVLVLVPFFAQQGHQYWYCTGTIVVWCGHDGEDTGIGNSMGSVAHWYQYQCRVGRGTAAYVQQGHWYQYHCGISRIWYWNWYWHGYEPGTGAGVGTAGALVPVLVTSGGGVQAQQRYQYGHYLPSTGNRTVLVLVGEWARLGHSCQWQYQHKGVQV